MTAEYRPRSSPLTMAEVQSLIESMYGRRDSQRGLEGTYMWFVEEVGELAAALRQNDRPELPAEFADVLAWLVTMANMSDIDLERAFLEKYGQGCPGCGQMVCCCQDGLKP